jgi:hypothetical protein
VVGQPHNYLDCHPSLPSAINVKYTHGRRSADRVSALEDVVRLTFSSWNQLMTLLPRIQSLRQAA